MMPDQPVFKPGDLVRVKDSEADFLRRSGLRGYLVIESFNGTCYLFEGINPLLRALPKRLELAPGPW